MAKRAQQAGLNFRIVAVLAVTIGALPFALAAPKRTSDVCVPTCKQSRDAKLNYSEGRTYIYNFESEATTSIVGATDDSKTLKVRGEAVIAAHSPCDLVLTLRNVVAESPSGQQAKVEDSSASARFALQNDGAVDGLCLGTNSTTWYANLKRGIISMFENRAEKNQAESLVKETDISGTCQTQYKVIGDTYVKTRNLNSCTHREGGNTVSYGVPYDVTSKHNSLPGVDSKLRCSQQIQDGIYTSVTCEENHQLKAFAHKQAGAQTVITSSLTLVTTNQGLEGPEPSVASRPSSIYFDHADSYGHLPAHVAAQRVRKVLNEMCPEIENGVISAKVPSLFIQLKKAMESVGHQDLKSIRENVVSEKMCKEGTVKMDKLLLDAAAMSAGDGAIALLAELYPGEDLSDETKAYFHIYTAFATRPGVVALDAMEKLLENDNSFSNGALLLAASGLGHRYCKVSNPKCGEQDAYVGLVNQLARQATTNCASRSKEDMEHAVVALQALGNLKYLPTEAIAAISKCMEGPERLQVRSLDAFRRDPCNKDLKDMAIQAFANRAMSSDVRIMAYITASKCIEENDVETIQKALNGEKSNQVLSFVASHIRNQQQASGPEAHMTRSVFRQLQLPRDVPSDVRKYSRNFQLSTFSPSMNLGGVAEADMIFSPNSYVPRISSANMTLHAFGRSYNFLEMGLYTEGLEHALEKYFGPSGKFKKSSINDLVKEGRHKIRQFANSIRPRSKRNANPFLNEELVEPYHNEVEVKKRYSRHGVVDAYVRVMGTAVMVSSFSSGHLTEHTLTEAVVEGVERLAEGAKNHKVDLTQPIPIVNDEVSIPTISGLPINFDVQGTTIVSLQMSGNLDIEKLLLSDEPNKFHASISPSAATTLIGRMTTGRGFVEVGVEVEGKIHTASGVEIKVEKEKEKFDLKIDLPQEKMQILDVRSELFWTEKVEGGQDKTELKEPINSNVELRSYANPNDCRMSNVLGLKLCTDAKFPVMRDSSPYFPLAGPSVISVALEKTESSMQGYHIRVVTDLTGETKQSVSVLFDTPGSQTNRKLDAKFKYTQEPYTKLELDVDSPWKKFSAFYEKQVGENVKSIDIAYLSDDNQYSGKAEMKISREGHERIYEPLLQYVTPSGTHKLLQGKLEVAHGKKLKLNLQTDAGNMKSLNGQIKAEMEEKAYNSGHKYEITTAELNFPAWNIGELKLSGDVIVAAPTFGVNLLTTYGQSGQTLALDSMFTHVKRQNAGLDMHLKSSALPGVNFDLAWNATMDQQTEALEHTLYFAQGRETDRLIIKHHSLYDTGSSKRFHIMNDLQIQRAAKNVDMEFKLNAKKVAGKYQVYNMTIRADQSHRAELSLRSGPDAFFDYNLQGVLQYPGQYYELTENARKSSADTWRYDTTFSQIPGANYTAITKLVLRNERNNVQNALETTVTSAALTAPIAFKCGILHKAASSSAFLVLQAKGEPQIDILTAYKQAGTKPQAIDVTALVKPYISMNLSEAHTRSSSKLNMKFKWMPTDRLITLDSLLKLHDQLTLDGTLKWDAEKDESKAVTLKSVTNFGVGWYIDNTNDITIEGKKSNIRMKGKLAKDVLNGEHLLDINYRNPENQDLGLYINNVMESRSKYKSSKLNAKVQLFEATPYQMDWENRLANIDTERLTVEAFSDMKVSHGRSDLHLHGEFNSMSTNKRSLSGQFTMSGTALSNALGFDYNTEWKNDAFKVNWNGNYGAKVSHVELAGKLNKVNNKKIADLTYKITTPVQPKSVEGTVQYGYTFQSWRNFEITESGSVAINNGIPSTWTNLVKSQDHEFQASSQIIREGSPFIDYGIAGRRDKKRFVLDVRGLIKERGARLFTNIDGTFPFYNIRANGSLKLEHPGKSSVFKFYHRNSQGGQSIDTDLMLVRSSGRRFVMTNKLENFPKRKSVDFLVTDGSTPRKVYMLVTENTPKWALDSYVKWGEGGKALATKGALEISNNLMDVVLSLDSPALNIDNWSARASRKLTNGRESIALDVEGKSERVVSVGLDYALKKTGSLQTYDGALKVETKKGQEFNGNFRVERSLFDRKRNNEEGQQIRASLDLLGPNSPLKFEVLSKDSDVEKKLAISMCNQGGKACRTGEFMVVNRNSGDEAENVIKATAQYVNDGQKSVDGLMIETRRTADMKNFEHSARIIVGQEKEDGQLGYRVYRSQGKEVGLEVQLPERLISAVATAERMKGHNQAQISFWMDKSRKPNEKLSALFSLQDIASEDHATGSEMILQVHHHALQQDIKLKNRLVSGGQNTILDLQTELDLFKSKGELAFGTKIMRQAVENGHTYQMSVSAKAPNPALNIEIDSNLTKTRSEVVLKTDLAYENRQKEMKKSSLNVQYSTEHASLTFGSAGAPASVLFSTNWNSRGRHGAAGYDVRYEFLIPGMADARIFESQLHPSIPPHANVKMYTSQTPDGEFYEAFIGFKSNKQFAAGLYHQVSADRNVIGDFNLALNSSRLLLVKADWEPKTIEKTLKDAQERLRQTGEGFKSALNSSLGEASEEIQALIGSLDNSLPELEPLAQAYSNEFQQIRQELKNSEQTKTLMAYVEKAENAVSNSTEKLMEVMSAAFESVSVAAEKLSARLGRVSQVFKNMGEKVPEWLRSVTESTDKAVDALVEGSSQVMERVGQVFQNIGPFEGYNWDFLNETSSGIGKFMHQAVLYTTDAFSSAFEYVKNLGAELAENTYIKNLATNTIARYENFLADMIEELKNHLEDLRESMLQSFPQQEAQEFLLALFEYAEKKARGTPVDDAAMREQIYNKFVAAVRKAGKDLYTFDLENGLILAQVPLPKPIDSLSDFDQLFILDFPKWKLSFRPNRPYSYGLSEFYNFLKVDSLGSLIHRTLFSSGASLPPTASVGLLVGSQYFRTFDGKFYHFEGNCQYLLASDFLDKNFTMAIDFESNGSRVQKSIMINYHGHSAVIRPDFTTEVQNVRRHSDEALSVTENEKGYITVKSNNGAIEVTCAKKQDVCVFVIDGYYHGKTMGLLGTNNNEKQDDFSAPKGNVVDDSSDFVASWKLGANECTEEAVPHHPENASRHARDACANMFKSKWSSLRSCYDVVNPTEFQELCENLSIERGYDSRKAVCSSSVAYSKVCSLANIDVETTPECQ